MKKRISVIVLGLLCLGGCKKFVAKQVKQAAKEESKQVEQAAKQESTTDNAAPKSARERSLERLRELARKQVIETVAKNAGAKKPRNLKENPLVKKGDQQVDPETLEPYSGRAFGLHDDKKSVAFEKFYINGKMHGLRTWYYNKNGNKWLEENWKDGKRHGLATVYREDGTKEKECQFTNGIKGECKTF